MTPEFSRTLGRLMVFVDDLQLRNRINDGAARGSITSVKDLPPEALEILNAHRRWVMRGK